MAKKRYNSIREIPSRILEQLSRFVTNVGGDTFVIHNLPPEFHKNL